MAKPEQTPIEQAPLFELPEGWQDDLLDNRDKLRALGTDPRAGFLPTTHTEKTAALILLDYIDVPSERGAFRPRHKGHPAKTAGQLQEVYRFHEKLHPDAPATGKAEAQRALRSIAFTFGDYLDNAITQKSALNQLKSAVDDRDNPGVTLAEVAGENLPGIAPLTRFFDLYELRRGTFPMLGFDPLKPRQVREGIDDPDRNKYIHDQYTGDEIDPAVAAHITQLAKTFTVGTVRTTILRGDHNLIDSAVIDQQKRINFWTGRLREARLHLAARPIADRVLSSLNIAIR